MGSMVSDWLDKRRSKKQRLEETEFGVEHGSMGHHYQPGIDIEPASAATAASAQVITPGVELVTGLPTKGQGMESPYVYARREWNERYGSYIAQAHTWKMVALGSMALSAILVFNLVSLANSSKVVPYVVEVDKLGNSVAVKPADKATTSDERIIRGQLSSFISNARNITPDRLVQKRWLDSVYAIATPSAATFLNDYYRKNDPFERSKGVLVSVEINSALPLRPSETTWQIQWTETTRGLDGLVQGVSRYQAILNTTKYTPTTEQQILANPSGIAVDQISWNQQL